jgi:hypothetical protein
MQVRKMLAISILFMPLSGCFTAKGEFLLYSPEKKS